MYTRNRYKTDSMIKYSKYSNKVLKNTDSPPQDILIFLKNKDEFALDCRQNTNLVLEMQAPKHKAFTSNACNVIHQIL